MLRIDGASGERLWRYDSPGGFQGWAIHPDGTIFFLEHTGTVTVNTIFAITLPRDAQAHLVALEGASGAVRFRVPLPASRFRHSAQGCSNPTPFPADLDGAPSFGLPSVLEDGSVYFEFLVTDHNWVESSVPGFVSCEPFRYEIGADLRLGTVTPAGEFSSRTLQTFPRSISCFPNNGACASPVFDFLVVNYSDVIPDGAGGALAAWRPVNSAQAPRVARVNAGAVTEYAFPFTAFITTSQNILHSMVLGEEGVAFASNGVSAIAFEVASGAARWSWTPPNQPSGEVTRLQLITSTANNGLVVLTHDNNSGFPFFGTVARLDSNGQATFDSWSATGIQYAYGDLWFSQGSALAITAPPVDFPFSAWNRPDEGGSRAESARVKVRAFRISTVDYPQAAIATHIRLARDFWQKTAEVLLDWDGTTGEVSPCPQELPNCNVTDPTVSLQNPGSNAIFPIVLRRFPERKGVNLVFTLAIQGSNGKAVTVVDDRSRFVNIVLAARFVTENVVPHEVGHVFSLEHRSSFAFPRNLMCDGGVLCSTNLVNLRLLPEQIHDARRAAKFLQ